MPNPTRALLLALALTTLLACKSDPPSPTPQGPEGEQEAPVAAPKILHHYRTGDFTTLDPMAQFDRRSMQIVTAVYDPLLEYHFLERPYALTPNLAARMPEVSEDGLTITIDLRDDVRFIDDPCFPDGKGRALVAEDVIYSYKRFADANVNNVSYYALLNDRVVGMDEFRAATKAAGSATDYSKLDIEGLKATGPHRLTIRLKRKDPLALMPLAASPLSIVPREAVEHYKGEFARHPVGTGPFRLDKNPRRGKIVLKKNPNYHMTFPTKGDKALLTNAGARLPLIDEIHLPLIEEAQPRMLNFLSGKIDRIALDKDAFAAMATRDASGFRLKPEHAAKFDMHTAPSLAINYNIINMEHPVLGKNKALRQAIAHALDTQGFIDKMRSGRGIALNSIVPVPIHGSERDTGLTWYKHDLARAAALLVEAGFPEGKGLEPITIEYQAANTQTRQDFEFQRAQLAKVGIVLEANFQTFSQYLKKLENKNFQIAQASWGADYPDAENFYMLIHGARAGTTYKNPEYDKRFVQARTMLPGPERTRILRELGEIIKEDVPIILGFEPVAFTLTQKRIAPTTENMMLPQPYKFLDLL